MPTNSFETEEYTKKALRNVNTLVSKVFDGNILEFAKIMAKFPNLDYKNQLLLWRQSPDATFVAGNEAYAMANREVISGAQPIILLYPRFILKNREDISDKSGITYEIDTETGAKIPSVYPEFTFDYTAVPVYDISNTTGDEDYTIDKGNLDIDEGLSLNGIAILPVDSSDLGDTGKYKNGIVYGGVDIEDGGVTQKCPTDIVFAIDRELIGLSRQNKLINMFVTFATDESREIDEMNNLVFPEDIETLAREIVIITTQHRFGSDIDSLGASLELRFKILADLSNEDKLRFIKRISRDSSEAIRAISGYYLTFNEIAIINTFVRTDKIAEDRPNFMVGLLKYLLNSQSDYMEDFRADIDNFLQFIDCVSADFIKKLYTLVKERRLYTYPPIKYELLSDVVDE